MRGLAKLTWVEMKLFGRDPLAAFFTLAFPVLLLVLFGNVFGNAPSPEYGGLGFVDVSVPAYAALIIATSALLSLSANLASYRELGVLRRLRVTPLHPLAILTAQVAVMFLMTVLGMMLLIVVGRLAFGLRCAGNGFAIAAAFTLSSLAFFALGFVLASVVRSVRSAQAVGMVIFYPMIFLSGAAMPRDLLPEGMQRAALALPLTHVVSLLQGLWLGDAWSSHVTETAVIATCMVVGIVVSLRAFRWE